MTTSTRLRPLHAIRALWTFAREPFHLPHVFVIVDALRGRSSERNLRKFRNTPIGARCLRERHELLDVLSDHARLRAMPPGSLGRAYLDFLAQGHITAEGMVDASTVVDESVPNDADTMLLRRRLRDLHDLSHVLTGYGLHAIGEACVLAFSAPQTRLVGIWAIALQRGFLVRRNLPGHPVMRAVFEAIRNGMRASWLVAEDIEGCLAEPVDVVRKRFGIRRAVRYERLVDSLGGEWILECMTRELYAELARSRASGSAATQS